MSAYGRKRAFRDELMFTIRSRVPTAGECPATRSESSLVAVSWQSSSEVGCGRRLNGCGAQTRTTAKLKELKRHDPEEEPDPRREVAEYVVARLEELDWEVTCPEAEPPTSPPPHSGNLGDASAGGNEAVLTNSGSSNRTRPR
jgi:hypothetical protein